MKYLHYIFIWLLLGISSSFAAPIVNAQTSLPDFNEIYEKQGAAVVAITTSQKVKTNNNPFADDEVFGDFFRRYGPRMPKNNQREYEVPGAGSGFIISSDGYIVTNHHVVENADEVTVRLTDKREFKAKVIGSDKRTDTALIKVDATGLPKVAIGDPGKLKVGEWVVAIGQPFGLENTLTAGVVSAKARSVSGEQDLVPFIQTDAAINPGNSGGPLFNMRGEVVGINSMIFSRSGGYMGLAFSIPIDVAMNVVDQLKSNGKVTRGRIGVLVAPVNKDTAEVLGLSKAAGALVQSLTEGGPAEKAGLKQGDVILKFDGKTIETSNELPRIVSNLKPGSKAVVQVWRNGGTKDLTVTLEEFKDDGRPGRIGSNKEKGTVSDWGVELVELTSEQKRELKISSGLYVNQITGNLKGDLQNGDIILAAMVKGRREELTSVDQLNKIVNNLNKNQALGLWIRRGENTALITIRPKQG